MNSQGIARAPAQPATIDELRACLAAAHAAGQTVLPIGCGTKWQRTHPPQSCDVIVSTRALSRLVAHEAADMTATVEAGVTLSELNLALTRAGQHLALDPPLPKSTTIGSIIATDACGPLRLTYGKVRDVLLGVSVVLADGSLVKGGGRVVKNVAGYDLMKLFTGSYGTLGVIVEATFKLRPHPEKQTDFVAHAATIAEVLAIGQSVLAASIAPIYALALNPIAASRLGFTGATLVFGCSGSEEEIATQRERLKAVAEVRELAGSAGTSTYLAMRDLPATSLGNDSLGAKLSALESHLPALLGEIEVQALAQAAPLSLIAYAGAGVAFVRCPTPSATLAATLVAATRAAGGWILFDAIPDALRHAVQPWPMQPPAIDLMRGIKRALDPHNRLSPGCFVGGI